MTPAQHKRNLQQIAEGRRRYHEDGPAAARAAQEDGVPVSEIASIFGVSRKAIYDLMKKNKEER